VSLPSLPEKPAGCGLGNSSQLVDSLLETIDIRGIGLVVVLVPIWAGMLFSQAVSAG